MWVGSLKGSSVGSVSTSREACEALTLLHLHLGFCALQPEGHKPFAPSWEDALFLTSLSAPSRSIGESKPSVLGSTSLLRVREKGRGGDRRW